MLETAIRKVKQFGYQLSRSIDQRQIEDLEELLAQEEKRRKELEEEGIRIGKEVREIGREEMERIMEKYERRMNAERGMEWNIRKVELGKEMRRVLEEWEERRTETNREERRKELERALKNSDDRIREDMGE